MALMRSTATAGSVSSSLGMRAWVLAVEEATETEGHFRLTGDGASGRRRCLWRIWGRVWEKAAGGAAWREDSCWIADALLDAGDRHGGAPSRDLALEALAGGVPEQRVSKCRDRCGLHRPELSQLRVCWTLVTSRVLKMGSQVTGYGYGGTVAVSEALPVSTETVLRLSTTPSPRPSPATPATPAMIPKTKKVKMLRSTHKHLGQWALHAVGGSNGGARRMCRARPNRPAHVMFVWQRKQCSRSAPNLNVTHACCASVVRRRLPFTPLASHAHPRGAVLS
jgi:hypothetical protein